MKYEIMLKILFELLAKKRDKEIDFLYKTMENLAIVLRH